MRASTRVTHPPQFTPVKWIPQSGVITSDGEDLGFVAQIESDNLSLTLFPYDQSGNPDQGVAQTLILARQGTAPAPPTAATASREVYINRVRLDNEVVQAMEAQYQIPIQNGRYW